MITLKKRCDLRLLQYAAQVFSQQYKPWTQFNRCAAIPNKPISGANSQGRKRKQSASSLTADEKATFDSEGGAAAHITTQKIATQKKGAARCEDAAQTLPAPDGLAPPHWVSVSTAAASVFSYSTLSVTSSPSFR
jgi:hypothetical protein